MDSFPEAPLGLLVARCGVRSIFPVERFEFVYFGLHGGNVSIVPQLSQPVADQFIDLPLVGDALERNVMNLPNLDERLRLAGPPVIGPLFLVVAQEIPVPGILHVQTRPL